MAFMIGGGKSGHHWYKRFFKCQSLWYLSFASHAWPGSALWMVCYHWLWPQDKLSVFKLSGAKHTWGFYFRGQMCSRILSAGLNHLWVLTTWGRKNREMKSIGFAQHSFFFFFSLRDLHLFGSCFLNRSFWTKM